MQTKPLLRTGVCIASLLLLLVACANAPDKPELKLREITVQEAEILTAMRKEGAAVVTDGCVFAKGLGGQQPIGIQESRELARLSAERIKALAEANGIHITATISPLICGSHAHLGTWPVGDNIDSSATPKRLPLKVAATPQELTGVYSALIQQGLAEFAQFPFLPKCLWCWGYEQISSPRTILTRTESERLIKSLGTRWILLNLGGGFRETSLSAGVRNTGGALVTIFGLLAGAGVSQDVNFGRDDEYKSVWPVINLELNSIARRSHKTSGRHVRFVHYSDDFFKDLYYPLLGLPNLHCKQPTECEPDF